VRQLREYRDDVDRILEAACHANLEFRQGDCELNPEARDVACNTTFEKMMAEISERSGRWDPAETIVSRELVSQSPNVIRPQFEEALQQEVENFARQFFDLLDHLVKRKLCGHVEWSPNQCCSYYFFRRVVIQTAAETNNHVVEARHPISKNEDLRWVTGQRTTTTTQNVTHRIQSARHEHDLIEAMRTSIRNSNVVMSPPITRLVESVPDWLYPFVEVVDGRIVREHKEEEFLNSEEWTRVDVHDEPIFHFDPAIIIGPFVLTGWGPAECHREQERRLAIRRAKDQSNMQILHARLTPVASIAAGLMVAAALWFLYRWLQGSGGLFMVVLATCVALAVTWQAFYSSAVRRREANQNLYAHGMTIGAGLLLLTTEWVLVRFFQSLS